MNALQVLETDVLVIGGGVTATRAAISAYDEGANVVLADKGIVGKSGGGPVAYSVTAALIRPPDSPEALFQDMVKSGQGLNNQRLVRVFAEDVAQGRVLDLEKFGIVFARTPDGNLNLRQMGGHSHPRDIASFHAASMVNVLVSEVIRRNIKVMSEVMITRLLTEEGCVVGAIGLNKKTGDLMTFRAKTTVLTAGGAGQAYGAGEISGYTTNLMEITGDSYAMAYRVGAELVDMEFVQSIPALAYPDLYKGVLLGEPSATNAKLYNSNRERFMERYDPERKERTTKDMLASSTFREVKAGRGTPHGGVWMDFSEAPPDSFHIFPLPFKEMGIDPKKDWVEMIPGIHYFMGGVRINERGETNIPGLYAAGEAAGGLHGANRLAGCSTADSNVFGARAGEYAALEALKMARPGINWEQVSEEQRRIVTLLNSKGRSLGITPLRIRRKIQALLWDDVGVLRNGAGLQASLEKLEAIRKEYEKDLRLRQNSGRFNNELIEAIEVSNMFDVAEIIARAALLREERRGGHYREDYPNRDDKNWLKNIVVKWEAGEMKLSTTPIVQ
jgi:fumarate reductase (CoM/CoB) subunit A